VAVSHPVERLVICDLEGSMDAADGDVGSKAF